MNNSWVLNEQCSSESKTPADYGLARIAEHFGKGDAVKLYWEGAAKEELGDIDGAISLYRRAYRMWPALDSVTYGGLPLGVREEAVAAGVSCQLDIIDVTQSRASQVMISRGLLVDADFEAIDTILRGIAAVESPLENNAQNATHKHKICTFLNNPPHHRIVNQAPEIINKMLKFGIKAWEDGNWSGDSDSPGPLHAISGGLPSLSIRVVEHWEYSVGGGLTDPLHYDVDSVLTLVALLSDADDFEGGTFRTNESDDTHLEHRMNKGDVICFISHKFHNIVPVTKGIRRSLVMELWQGGVGHEGR